MKKILFTLLLVLAGQVVYAQDMDQLMNELSKVEGAKQQVMNKEMLNKSVPEDKADMMPAFMSKMDSVVAVVVQNCPSDINEKIQTGINTAERSETYESLVSVKKENNKVSILATKGESDNKAVYIYVAGGNAVVFVKMCGALSVEDLQEIVKEQQKNEN